VVCGARCASNMSLQVSCAPPPLTPGAAAFYAQAEELRNPQLAGKPIGVTQKWASALRRWAAVKTLPDAAVRSNPELRPERFLREVPVLTIITLAGALGQASSYATPTRTLTRSHVHRRISCLALSCLVPCQVPHSHLQLPRQVGPCMAGAAQPPPPSPSLAPPPSRTFTVSVHALRARQFACVGVSQTSPLCASLAQGGRRRQAYGHI
jgi:hypothetical protein